MRSPREIAERWAWGMRRSPPIPCPICGGKTMAYSSCQYCKSEWTKEQLEQRNKERTKLVLESNQP